MADHELIQRVKAVHAELKAEGDPAKQDVARQLETVMLEPDQKAHYSSLADKLLALEVDHPKLATSIQQLVELLTSAGL
ncbi:MAG TPA: hypothetical protein VGL61_22240 [Kofleriaceae bacterium]|jgi:hypothetical protein